MHNRARMTVGSFLTKDLHAHWRLGESHFMQHLVDEDQVGALTGLKGADIIQDSQSAGSIARDA